MNLVERFMKYIKIYTTSDESSTTVPSTERQLNLANVLKEELIEMGLTEVTLDEFGIVMATLEGNIDKEVPVIGFLSHMDTAPDLTTEGIHPRIVEKYQGGDIVLNKELDIRLSPEFFPEMENYIGQDLIVTDGTTLLGADDKAGIAEIITAIEYLMEHPEIPHGKIRIAFTPDEEIGRGADHFDVEKFGADFGYTVDGGELGELEYECFNASNAKLVFYGRNVHPGSAKDKMINAMEILQELHSMLPKEQKPEYTQDYEGFLHQTMIEGNVEEAKTEYIIRDHDTEKFEHKKKVLKSATDFINIKYGEGTVNLIMEDSYYNMGKQIEPVFHIVEIAKTAMEELKIEPLIAPIRGGSDGSRLSFMGLPCPNFFTGGHNFHGKYEYIPIQSMEAAVKVIVKIAEGFTK